jgi:hypothetical protein
MIPFDLRNLLQNSILLILILVSNKLFAQQDTVVVYEYIYQTDTVWLKPEPNRDTTDLRQLQNIDDATLIIDTTNHKSELVIFSSGQSATIPINRILLNENHLKLNRMKKVSFFTMFFLAVQSIAYAQPDISIKAGISQFWWNGFAYKLGGVTMGDNEGIELKGPLALKNFSFSAGYEHHSYASSFNLDFVYGDSTFTQNNRIMESFRSFPLLIYYRMKRFELFAGYEYRLVRTDVSMSQTDGRLLSNFSFRQEHALAAGVEFKINNRLSAYSKICMGGIFVDRLKNSSLNGNSLDFSLKYYLYRNPSFASGR